MRLCLPLLALSPVRQVVLKMSVEPDFDLLNRRVGELRSVGRQRCVVLPEALLPGQRARLPLTDANLAALYHKAYVANTTIGVVGTGEHGALSHGVEARVASLDDDAAMLIGMRVFERVDVEALAEAGISAYLTGDVFSADVRWVDIGLSDELSAARSPSRAVTLASRELGALVERWLSLTAGSGGTDLGGRSQQGEGSDAEPESVVAHLLADLGELPSADCPSQRALWVVALINPFGRLCPDGTWPAMDVRKAILTAATPLERLSVAKTAMIDSLYKIKGGEWPMNTCAHCTCGKVHGL